MSKEFKSRAVRSLVGLHEQELLRFLATWDRFLVSYVPVPEAFGDENYKDRESLCAHVMGAAHADLIWIGALTGRPVPALEGSNDPSRIAAGLRLFAAYRLHFAELTDAELFMPRSASNGTHLTIETILEHGIVHAMRHRFQLERLLEACA
ncbi:MAG: hypothetical protein HY291_17835 [Planctomycetes bacterium]|nr:hypothetical protein [Planctomycetota bacterium]